MDVIDKLAELVMEEQEAEHKTDEARIGMFNAACDLIQSITECDSFTVKKNKPVKGAGVISVNGREITFTKPEYFVAVCKAASNVEFYSKTNGTTQISFMFYGISRKIN